MERTSTAESTRYHGTHSPNVGFRERIHHLTWAWYASTMATGGIALLIHETPHRFRGLDTIGTIVFIFDTVVFFLTTIGIVTRFALFQGTLRGSLTHTSEALFFPTFWLSIANIINNIASYGIPHCGPWLVTVLRVLFWIYTALTLLSAWREISAESMTVSLTSPSDLLKY